MPNMTVTAVEKAASDFLMQALHAIEVRIIGVKRIPEGWEAQAEVYEESAFIKALGLPTRVRDRNLYVVLEDDQMEVTSFERKDLIEPCLT